MMPALLLGAGLVALALLLVLYWRTSQRILEMKDTMERLKVLQRDMSADVRARLDEGARTWESVEHEMRPRIEQLEPAVADLSSTLEEHLPGMGETRSRLDRVEERTAEMQTALRETLDREAQAAAERVERIEEAVRTLRDAADERLAAMAARVAALEPPPEPPPEDIEDPVAAVEAAAEAPATYGSGRKRMGRRSKGKAGHKPSRWRFWRSRTESASQ